MVPGNQIFKRLDTPREATLAVVQTYDDFEEAGREPAAEHWTTTERGRADVHMRVAAAWAKITRYAEHQFPYTRDVIVELWLAYRKEGKPGTVIKTFATGGGALFT